MIESPQVVRIDAQGIISYQVVGAPNERPKLVAVDISEDDITLVMKESGISDRERAKKALTDSGGDLAQAIIALRED